MTELALLEQRLELVRLSARLQRATVSRRLGALEAEPGRALVGMALQLAAQPLARRTALAAAVLAWRSLRRFLARRAEARQRDEARALNAWENEGGRPLPQGTNSSRIALR